MQILANSVWRFIDIEGSETGLYRVLRVYPKLNYVAVFSLELEGYPRRPFALSIDFFNSAVIEKSMVPGSFHLPSYMLVDESEIPLDHKRKRDSRFELIRELVSNSEFLLEYSTSLRSSSLTEYAEGNDAKRRKVSRFLNQYWRYGQDRNALLPAYKNCGGAGKNRKAKGVALGAPKKSRTLAVKRSKVYLLKDTDIERIRKCLKKYHLKTGGKNLKQTYDLLLKEHYPETAVCLAETEELPSVPSYKQFCYQKNKLFTADEITRCRNTERNYLLTKRGLLGSINDGNDVPGSCFEIDATVADVHIVSKFNRDYVLGRPTIYFIVDRNSGFIVGINVSLFYASWSAARMALANAFLPKSEYCAEFGIEIDDSEWPASHIPEKLMCDNGEMMGLKPEETVVPFTDLEFHPPYRPDFKAMVESRFGIVNKKLLHELLGTTLGGKIVRGEPNPAKESIYTLEDLTTLLIDEVLTLNGTPYDRLAYTDPLLFKNNLSPTPINCWNAHLDSNQHSLRSATASEVISRLYPTAQVFMTKSGIEFNGMFYSCERVVKEQLAAKARSNGRWKLTARVNENTTNYIYVRFDEREEFIRCDLLPKSKMLKDSPLYESDVIIDWIKEKKEMTPISGQSLESHKRRKKIEANAKRRAREQRKLSKSARLKNIKLNRANEIKETTHKLADSTKAPSDEYRNRKSYNVTYLPSADPAKKS